MPTESFTLHVNIPATPRRLWESWVDGEGHAAMTGSPATSDPVIGGIFTAWDGYIQGRWQELRPAEGLVMTWRTTAFPEGAADSLVAIRLDPDRDGGTDVTLHHSGIPEGQGADYERGWETHYFAPMREHFGGG